MIHVLLDTTVLRQDPSRKKSAFEVVTQLAKEATVRVHVSDVTRREFACQLNEKSKDDVNKVLSGINGLSSILTNDGLNSSLLELHDKLRDAGISADDNFNRWLAETNSTVHTVKDTHGQRVLVAYFEGHRPFKSIKSRKDFPDAFIWQAVTDLLNEVDLLHVVTADDNFSRNLKHLDRVTVHQTLLGFVKSEAVSCHLKHTPNLSAFLLKLRTQLPRLAEKLEKALITELCDGLQYFGDDYDSGTEVSITGVGAPTDLDIGFDDADDLGGGVISVPFSLNVECLYSYYMDKSDYYFLDDDTFQNLSADIINDHTVEVEEERDLCVSGLLSIQANVSSFDGDDNTEHDVRALLDNATIEIDEVTELAPVG